MTQIWQVWCFRVSSVLLVHCLTWSLSHGCKANRKPLTSLLRLSLFERFTGVSDVYCSWKSFLRVFRLCDGRVGGKFGRKWLGKRPHGRPRRKWMAIIAFVFREIEVWRDGLGSTGSGHSPTLGFCEHDGELWCPIKSGKFVTNWATVSFSRKMVGDGNQSLRFKSQAV